MNQEMEGRARRQIWFERTQEPTSLQRREKVQTQRTERHQRDRFMYCPRTLGDEASRPPLPPRIVCGLKWSCDAPLP